MNRRHVVNVVCALTMAAGAGLTFQGFTTTDPEPQPAPVVVPVAPSSTPKGPVVSI